MNMNNTEQTSVNPYDQLLKLKYPESYEIQNDQTNSLPHTGNHNHTYCASIDIKNK